MLTPFIFGRKTGDLTC